MGSFLSSALIVTSVPCVILLLYTLFPHPIRLILQTFILLPILLICSIIVSIINGLLKYLGNNIISISNNIYIRQELYKSFGQVEWFIFEWWTNLKYVYSSDIDLNNNIFNGNCIFLGNHSESLFDFIPFGSIADYFNRTSKSFVFIKKELLYFPIMGWVEAVSPHGITLNRKWDIDKIKINTICNEMMKEENGDYKQVSPWSWFIFPEGTRFNKEKLKKAQQFAKERGFPIYDNILQPRVKGFSYLTHHLHKSLKSIIDITILYNSKPPKPIDIFYKTRFCKFIHIHLRVYKQKDIPIDIKDLDEWIRNRWTEKDKIIQKMKNNEINYKILPRSPWRAIKYYLFYAFIYNYFIINYFFGYQIFVIIFICSIIPIAIVLIQDSQKIELSDTD